MDELTTPTLPWWRRLVVQLVALVLAAAFLPLLVMGIRTIQAERSQAIQQVRQVNLAQAEGIAERVASHVRQAATELKVLAGSPPLRSGDWDAAWVELERLQSQYPDLAVLTLTDTAGDERVKVSAMELVLPGSLGSRAQSPDFLATMQGETYLGDLQFVTGAGQRLPVSVPVFDAARQEVIGVLSAELALRDLLEAVGTTRVGQTGYAYVVDDRGRIVAHPDFSLVLAQVDASAIPETQDFLAGLREWQEPEFSAYDSLAGEPVFGVHAPIGAPNWSVTVEQPAAEVLAPVRTLTVQFSFLWGVTVLLAAGLAVALTLFVARPVSQLTRTAQRLAAGDQSVRVPVGRQDEVGLLATSFNHMVESIQQAESQRDATLEALRESEERFRSVYSQSAIGIELYDSNGDLIDANPECLDIFGVRNVEAVKGFDLFEDPNLSDEAQRRILDGQPVKYEAEFDFDIVKEMALYETTKSGKCYLDVLIAPWDVRKQDQKGFLVHVRDITGRKQAEGALRESGELLSNIVESMSDGILVLDHNFHYTYWNRAMETISKVPREDLIGTEKRPWDVFPHLAEQGVDEMMRQAMRGEVVQREDISYRLPDGMTGFTSEVFLPLRNPVGELRGIVGVIRDITERKRAERELIRLSSAMRMSKDSVVLADLEGKITDVNAATLRMYGTDDREDLIGRDTFELIIPEERGNALAGMAKLLETGYLEDREYHIITRSGGTVFVEMGVAVVKDAEGEPIGLVSISRDITERKQAEEELRAYRDHLEKLVAARTAELDRRVAEVEQLNQGLINLLDDLQAANRNLEETAGKLEAVNKELEAFTYSVSHDLRAPLRHADCFAQLLLQREAAQLEPTSARYLQNIVAAAGKMGRLIDDLLALSRTSQTEMKLRRVAPNEIVEQVRHELEPAIEGRRITWEIAPLPAVRADPGLLRVVLTNLLSNAVKYTAPRPQARIEIGATPPDGEGQVTFFIRDDGVGFDPQYAHKLFGVFQRLHRDEEFEGIGIGLATVRRIIHRHGGRVWAEGELDRGATFYFTLSVPQGE